MKFVIPQFHVESTFEYLGDRIGQCGGYSDGLENGLLAH